MRNLMVGIYYVLATIAWTVVITLLVLLLPFGHRTHDFFYELFSKLPEPKFK